ncbi:MAG TPA: hypothetical protein VGR47_05835 [Terracidiphilus sp.]|nr:hypothetical protein [Terracidiphilus sp.]
MPKDKTNGANAGPEKELLLINFANINDGAMVEGFEIELQRALHNIADFSTPATATRVVRLELILKPHSDRVVIETEFKCACKLAPIETHKSKVFLGRGDEGALLAFDADPRQMSLWSAPKPQEAPRPIEFKA